MCGAVTLTLREILDLEPLRTARPRVLAGRGRLDEIVRWVHVTELPDIAYLLRGGELLLTTGMAIAGSSRVQERYIAELAAARVSGLVVELGRNFRQLPGAMIEAAESAGLPLVALEREARFVEVTEAVHREIINRQYELLRRAEQVSRELTELILSGAGLGRNVDRLAEIFGNHVVLEDDAHQVVEIAGVNDGLGEVLVGWDEHARGGHDEVERGTVHRHDGAPRCMWVTLWLRHEPWGRLHVLETRSRLDDITELLVDRAGASISLTLLSEKDAAHLADRARSALVGEVVSGRYGPTADFLRRARSLGADLGAGRLVVLAVGTSWPAWGAAAGHGAGQAAASDEERRLAVRAAVATDIRQLAADRGWGALVGLSGDHILAVLAVPGARPLPGLLDELIDQAAARGARAPAATGSATSPIWAPTSCWHGSPRARSWPGSSTPSCGPCSPTMPGPAQGSSPRSPAKWRTTGERRRRSALSASSAARCTPGSSGSKRSSDGALSRRTPGPASPSPCRASPCCGTGGRPGRGPAPGERRRRAAGLGAGRAGHAPPAVRPAHPRPGPEPPAPARTTCRAGRGRLPGRARAHRHRAGLPGHHRRRAAPGGGPLRPRSLSSARGRDLPAAPLRRPVRRAWSRGAGSQGRPGLSRPPGTRNGSHAVTCQGSFRAGRPGRPGPPGSSRGTRRPART